MAMVMPEWISAHAETGYLSAVYTPLASVHPARIIILTTRSFSASERLERSEAELTRIEYTSSAY